MSVEVCSHETIRCSAEDWLAFVVDVHAYAGVDDEIGPSLPETLVTSGPVTSTAVFPPFPDFSEENPPPEDFVFEPISESIDFPNRIQDVCALIT
jgi:hypothetical protein